MVTEILVFLATLLLYYVWRTTKRPPNFPPGPWNLPIFGYALSLRNKPLFVLSKLAKRYGKIIGLNIGTTRVVILNDVNLAKEAFKRPEMNGRPNTLYFGLRTSGRLGVISAEGRGWKEQRQFMVQKLKALGFGKSPQEKLIHREIQEAFPRIKDVEGKPVELESCLGVSIMNITFHLGYGQRYNHNDTNITELAEKTSVHFGNVIILGLLNFFSWIVYLFPKTSGFENYMNMVKSLNTFNDNHIENHLKTYDPKCSRDIIDHYLHIQNNTTDSESSFFKERGDANLKSTLQDIFLAASDTGVASASWAVLFMILNPQVQKKCQEEIDRVVGNSRLPGLDDKARLPYCEATCNEILRKGTIAPMMNFHCVLQDSVLDGYDIPKDTLIIANVWHIHHDEDVWGDPHSFRPERFIAKDGSFQRNSNLVPFGIGKRICPGEASAKVTLFLFLTGILHTHSLSLPPGANVPSPMDFSHGIVSNPSPYKVIFKHRKQQ